MSLNRIESFNALTARTTRRGWPWLATRGSRLWPRPPARGRLATTNPPCRGGPVAAKAPLQGGCRPPARGGRPQGQQLARGDHAGAAARDDRPLAGRLPTAMRSAVACAGAAMATAA
ncbi:hypothetical protein GW17_00056682 [Ensete ventricosum]|nr:hypothetical protein GW17_00056682 [Ensete ventricosum]